jgi:hypothetical protein
MEWRSEWWNLGRGMIAQRRNLSAKSSYRIHLRFANAGSPERERAAQSSPVFFS